MSLAVAAVPLQGRDPRLEGLIRGREGASQGESSRNKDALPTPPSLGELLPGGGLLPGAVYSVTGGALLASLLAGPSRAGLWCGAIGLPEFGVEAAEQAGVDLRRLVLIPNPGDRWFNATAAVAEVMPVVAVRPSNRVREGDAARLVSRLRSSGTALLVVGPWPRAEATLSAATPRWSGLGEGHGYLASRDVVVTVTSKRTPTPRRVRLTLPDSTGGLALSDPGDSARRESGGAGGFGTRIKQGSSGHEVMPQPVGLRAVPSVPGDAAMPEVV